MKKITLMMLSILLCSGFSANAANLFLVANNGSTWTSTPTGFTNVYKIDLSTCNASAAASLTEFLTDRTLATPTYTVTAVTGSGNPKIASGDQVWLAGGTYNVSTPYAYTAVLNIYGGFAGTETTTSRTKGSNSWDFTNETIINGSSYTTGTAAIFTATGDRAGAIFDGMTFTACPTVPAVWVRAATIRYCRFTSNTFTALSLTTAGATTAVCTDCYFSGNSAPVSASNAACINANQTGAATITNCVFENNSNANTSTGATAGVKVLGTGTTSISNCVFRNNNATAGYSSAVSLNVAGGSLSNCLIYGNTGLPAIYMLGGTVYNCTVVNNTAGGASLAQTTTTPTCNIYNSVFWGTDANSGTVTVANASTTGDFKYNATSSAIPIGSGLTVSGNIVLPQNNTTGTNAPNFNNPASNDWSLISASSLIDIGNGFVSGVPSIDYVNVSRPMGGAYDIGAYEYTSSQEKASNGGFESLAGTVVESTTNVLMRVAATFDATTQTAAPTATATSVSTGLWLKKAPNAAAVKGVVVTTDKHSGTSCLNFKIGTGLGAGYDVWTKTWVQQKISLQNTLKYTVTFWAKVDATTPNQAGNINAVGVFLTDNLVRTILSSTVTLTSTWAQYRVTFDIPAHVAANPTADFTTAYVGVGLATTYDGASKTNYSGMLLDDFSVAPALGSTTVSSTSLSGFNYTYAAGPSSEQSFIVGGSDLASNLLVAPTADYEVSTTSGAGYQSTAISLAPTSGTVSNTTIYTRLKSGLNAGSYNSENINVGIMGVTNTPKTVSCSGTIAPAPLTITGISIANKVYDGTNEASITGTAAYSGLVNGETPAIAGTPVATFADAAVGNGKSVTVSGYAAPSANYSITQPTGFTANIYPVTSTFSKSGSSNWSTATEWTYTPIAATDLIISSGELVIDQSPTVHSITVNPGAKLTLTSGQTLTTGTLTLNSDVTNGTATFVDNGGTLTAATTNVQQYLGTARNWYVSSPVSNAKAPTGFTYYQRDVAGASWLTQPFVAGDTYVAGKGYIALPGSTNATLTFTTETGGHLNTGNVPITLSAVGFTLIGNPYPCHLTWTKIFTDANASLIESTIYYRTNAGSANNSGQWSYPTFNAYSGESVNGGSAIIPPMQAFWVKSKATGTLTLDSKLTLSHQSSNPLKVSESKNTDRQRLRLLVSNGTSNDETLVYFDTAANNGYDAYDSPKISNNSTVIPEIFTIVGNENLVINGLNSIPYDTEIPLGFTTGLAGTNFSIKASQISNFEVGTQISLKDFLDMTNPVVTDLSDGSSYSFTSEVTNNNTTRFALVFKAPSIATSEINSINGKNLRIYSNENNQISIDCTGMVNANKTVVVHNSVGQKLCFKQLTASITVLDHQFSSGVYFVTVNIEGNITTKKVIIN